MSDAVRNAIAVLLEQTDLTTDQMQSAIGSLMDGEVSPVLTSALLTALRMKGEAVAEIVGAARAMSARVTPIDVPREGRCESGLLDTCGTGGDSLHTFNISTATAIVTAACGVPIAKHGNRSVSSRSGSADVLESLGVRIDLTPQQVSECIQTVGIGFCFAPLLHGAMKHAAPVRRELAIRTIFNLLGPLTNPAAAEFQLLGANSKHNAKLIADALSRLGRKRAVVVCGNNELDEVSLWGETTAFIITGSSIEQQSWSTDDFGLGTIDVADLKVDSPDASAGVIRSVLNNEAGPALDIVLANVSAGLIACGRAATPAEGVVTARNAIASGKAIATLEELVSVTQAFASVD